MGVDQPLAAIAFGLRQLGIVDRAGQVAGSLGRRRLIGTGVDHKQHVTGFHLLAVLETDLGDTAGNLGTDLGRVDRIDAAGKLGKGLDRLGLQGGHSHGCRRRGCRGGRLGAGMPGGIAAANQEKDCRAHQLAAQPFGRPIGLLADEALGLGKIEMRHGKPRISVMIDTDIRLDFPRQANYITNHTKKGNPMRTGRPRSFCKDEALDRAMTVFWRQGYEGASLSDLTKAMGINPPSLYACFGSKEGLFKAVLEHYDQRRAKFLAEVLAAPTAAAAAETFLMGVAAYVADTGGNDPPGCLTLQGGLSCCDKVIPDSLARNRAEKETMLRKRFEEAKKSGDLPKNSDPAALARYLMVMANGICVQAAAGASQKELKEVASIALANWPAMVRAASKKSRAKEPA